MEELLNKLIEKGWKPFGSYKDNITRYKYDKRFFEFNHEGDNMVSIRELVSKDSGLWQFCVENNLVKLIENPNENKLPRDRMSEEEYRMWEYNVYYSFSNKKDIHKRYEQDSLTYRLIESALKDESDLEDFLLSNIVIKDEKSGTN